MSCNCNCDKELASLKGTLSIPLEVTENIVVESQVEPAVTYTHGQQVVTITHEKDGYDCYLFNCEQYGITDDFFVYIKDVNVDSANLIINNRGDEITGSIGTTLWLCIPK